MSEEEAPGVSVSRARSDTTDWVRARKVSFELGPLVEMVQGKQVQVGFTISLSAPLPLDKAPGAARQAAAAEIREGLRHVVEALVLPEGSRARVEIDAPRPAVVLESGRAEPDVVLDVRVFHQSDYLAEVTLDEEKRLRGAAAQLTALGLQERRPAPRR